MSASGRSLPSALRKLLRILNMRRRTQAYTLFYIIGTFGATHVPVVGMSPLKSLEQLGGLAVFAGYAADPPIRSCQFCFTANCAQFTVLYPPPILLTAHTCRPCSLQIMEICDIIKRRKEVEMNKDMAEGAKKKVMSFDEVMKLRMQVQRKLHCCQ